MKNIPLSLKALGLVVFLTPILLLGQLSGVFLALCMGYEPAIFGADMLLVWVMAPTAWVLSACLMKLPNPGLLLSIQIPTVRLKYAAWFNLAVSFLCLVLTMVFDNVHKHHAEGYFLSGGVGESLVVAFLIAGILWIGSLIYTISLMTRITAKIVSFTRSVDKTA